jgi:hypothetical protein
MMIDEQFQGHLFVYPKILLGNQSILDQVEKFPLELVNDDGDDCGGDGDGDGDDGGRGRGPDCLTYLFQPNKPREIKKETRTRKIEFLIHHRIWFVRGFQKHFFSFFSFLTNKITDLKVLLIFPPLFLFFPFDVLDLKRETTTS